MEKSWGGGSSRPLSSLKLPDARKGRTAGSKTLLTSGQGEQTPMQTLPTAKGPFWPRFLSVYLSHTDTHTYTHTETDTETHTQLFQPLHPALKVSGSQEGA